MSLTKITQLRGPRPWLLFCSPVGYLYASLDKWLNWDAPMALQASYGHHWSIMSLFPAISLHYYLPMHNVHFVTT
jgi:hypothetical protein